MQRAPMEMTACPEIRIGITPIDLTPSWVLDSWYGLIFPFMILQ
jgi:hypothetical protein